MYSLKEYVVKSSVCEIEYMYHANVKDIIWLKVFNCQKKNVLKKITLKIRPFYSIENVFYLKWVQ